MTSAELIADVDRRVRHIQAQVRLGANEKEVVAEQSRALLTAFSMLPHFDLDGVTAVSNHLANNGMWSRTQLSAFSACLRAAANRLHQPSTRPMQSNKNVEHFLVQSDWDALLAEVKPSSSQQLEIVAIRLHGYGLVCPDADTLKRASAIVQTCSDEQVTDDEKRSWAHEVKGMLKKLDEESPWPFEYIRTYPRSPFELPDEVLEHACGHGVRPVSPPASFKVPAFKLAVASTPYKKKQESRLDQTPDQTSEANALLPTVPTPSAPASSGLGGGPFAALMSAFVQAAGMHQMGFGTHPHAGFQGGQFRSRCALQDAPITKTSNHPLCIDVGTKQAPTAASAPLCIDVGTEQAPTAASAPKVEELTPSDQESEESEKSGSDALAHLEAKMTKSRKAVAKRRTAPIKKRPAAQANAPPAKRPAASTPVAKFDLEAWMEENIQGADAREATHRRYYVDNMRNRMERAASKSGVSHARVMKMRGHVRAKAGTVYDSVHPA